MGTGLNNLHAYIGCQGTVNHLIAKDNVDQRTYFEYYNFAKNKLDIYDGSVKTEEQYYSKTAPAATAAATPEATAASRCHHRHCSRTVCYRFRCV